MLEWSGSLIFKFIFVKFKIRTFLLKLMYFCLYNNFYRLTDNNDFSQNWSKVLKNVGLDWIILVKLSDFMFKSLVLDMILQNGVQLLK